MWSVSLEELATIATKAKGDIDTIYLHWTAGRYGQYFESYHINIDNDGQIYVSTDDLTERKSHTWRRNSRAIGIALCCCYGAEANNGYDTDFGDYPPTQEQIETMAKVVAILCKNLDMDINKDNVMTHGEAALLDGYGPCQGDPDLRWDLWYLPDNPIDSKMVNGGKVIRGKANWYLQSWGD